MESLHPPIEAVDARLANHAAADPVVRRLETVPHIGPVTALSFVATLDQVLRAWATRIAARRGRRVAAVALARRLAGNLYAMWRDGTNYQPRRATVSETAMASEGGLET
jgi:hypothetical protein